MIVPASILTILLESAARSLLLAGTVGAGLALLRTRNVPARKTAWMLVLAASFAMPVLARWAAQARWIPDSGAIIISASGWHATSPDSASANLDFQRSAAEFRTAAPVPRSASGLSTSPASGVPHFASPTITIHSADVSAAAAPSSGSWRVSPSAVLLILFLAGCCTLMARIAVGVWAAVHLWSSAVRLDLGALTSGLRVRSSPRIASPVTVGSGIVLPASYRNWDREKLRIVLAHESSHVHQGDFYLQLCASLYAALFWFSPLGWWLKRTLSDLSETISDRAAVEHAANHASYAQVLLEFAALPRPISTGVAMARHGRVVPRIERLLNESSFRQAFTGTRARVSAAVLLVLAGLFGATALLRVQAATQQAPPATVPSPDSTVPPTHPAAPAAAPQAEPPTVAPAAAGKQAPAAPSADLASPSPLPDDEDLPAPAVAPGSHTGSNILVLPGSPSTPGGFFTLPNAKALANQAKALALLQAQNGKLAGLDRHNFYRFGFGDDGNSYAYVTGEGEKNVHYSGNQYDGSRAEIEAARKVAHGDFIWFKRDGKSYVIDDPALLAALKPMQDQMDALGQKQGALGKQQEELGRQQEALGRQMQQLKVPTPDMKKEMQKLQAVTAKIAAIQGKNTSEEELAELQGQLAEVQSKLAGLQGDMGGQMGELGGKMGELGGQQGELGAEQGRLGAQQGRIAREMDGKILSLIDECMKNGKAHLVP